MMCRTHDTSKTQDTSKTVDANSRSGSTHEDRKAPYIDKAVHSLSCMVGVECARIGVCLKDAKERRFGPLLLVQIKSLHDRCKHANNYQRCQTYLVGH